MLGIYGNSFKTVRKTIPGDYPMKLVDRMARMWKAVKAKCGYTAESETFLTNSFVLFCTFDGSTIEKVIKNKEKSLNQKMCPNIWLIFSLVRLDVSIKQTIQGARDNTHLKVVSFSGNNFVTSKKEGAAHNKTCNPLIMKCLLFVTWVIFKPDNPDHVFTCVHSTNCLRDNSKAWDKQRPGDNRKCVWNRQTSPVGLQGFYC